MRVCMSASVSASGLKRAHQVRVVAAADEGAAVRPPHDRCDLRGVRLDGPGAAACHRVPEPQGAVRPCRAAAGLLDQLLVVKCILGPRTSAGEQQLRLLWRT